MELLEQQTGVKLIDCDVGGRMRGKGTLDLFKHPFGKGNTQFGGTLRIQLIEVFHQLHLLFLLGMLRAVQENRQRFALFLQFLILRLILDIHDIASLRLFF